MYHAGRVSCAVSIPAAPNDPHGRLWVVFHRARSPTWITAVPFRLVPLLGVHPLAKVTTTVPQEIIDMIIGFLAEDRASLLTCLIAGNSFCSPDRAHLFADIEVNSLQRFQGLLALYHLTHDLRL